MIPYPTRAQVATASKEELEHWYRELSIETSAEERVVMDAIKFKLTDLANGVEPKKENS